MHFFLIHYNPDYKIIEIKTILIGSEMTRGLAEVIRAWVVRVQERERGWQCENGRGVRITE